MTPALLATPIPTAAAPQPIGAPRFDDRSAALGPPEITWRTEGVHGVAWLDADADGDLDLVHTNGIGAPPRLWWNEPDGFRRDPAFGLAAATGTSGALAADLDGDDRTDLLLLGQGATWRRPPTPPVLLRNQGDGTFTDVAAASGLHAAAPPIQMAATAADVDGDGDLEVLVTAPGGYQAGVWHPDALLFREDGRWVDRAADWGVAETNGNCVASFAHLDDDAWIDLVVGTCNDRDETPPRVYLNRDGASFVRVDVERRVWAVGRWMGFAFGDFDADGRVDFFGTNVGDVFPALYAPPVLWLQSGDGGAFVEVPAPPGIGARFGWGTVAEDVDLDGHLDLIQVGTPQVFLPGIETPGSAGDLGLGRGDGTFVRGDLGVDLTDRRVSGLAAADYDGDGYVDLAAAAIGDVLAGTDGGPVLLHNVGGDGTWLAVRPRDQTSPNRAAIGARIAVRLPDGRWLRRQVLAGTSFASTDAPWPTFGLAGADEARLCVRWPDGPSEDFGPVRAGARFDAVRGAGVELAACGGDPHSPGDTAGTEPPPPSAACGCRAADTGAGWVLFPLPAMLPALRVRGRRRCGS